MDPRTTISAFDEFLSARGHHAEAVVIGGTALALLGVVSRPTRDCDILFPPIDPESARLAKEFAIARRSAGDPLSDTWWNNGPATLASVLPTRWQDRLVVVFLGQALVLRTLGRGDLLATKLFALCDRGTDLPDCVALAPTRLELADAMPWLEQQDANPDWPAHVRSVMSDLALRLYGI